MKVSELYKLGRAEGDGKERGEQMSKVFLFLLVLGIIKGSYNTVFSIFHAIRWGLVATSSPEAIVNHNAATELANMNLRVLFVLIAILWIQLFVMFGDSFFAISSLK